MEDIKDSAVLFVDDEEDILDVLKKEFKSTVGTIHLASNAHAALEITRQHQLDLAVLDLKMPDMDGITLYRELQAIKPSLPCIFLTAHGDKENIQEALRLGAEDFIDKPFDSAFLRLAIIRGIEKSRYERLLREVLELFIHHYTKHDFSRFDKLPPAEKEKTIRAALGLARVQILKKNRTRNA